MASPLRKLTRDDVVFEVKADEDDLPIVGNAQVSGDPAADRALERELLLRRAQGDVWAWALVRVIATWKSFRGVAVLGGCSYPSRAAFLEDAYYDDLKVQALDDLQARVQLTYDNLAELVVDESAALQEEVVAPTVNIEKVFAFILIYRGWVMLEPFTDAENALVKAALRDDDKALYMLARLLGVEEEMKDTTKKFDTLRVRDTLMVAYGRMSEDEQARVKHLLEVEQLHGG